MYLALAGQSRAHRFRVRPRRPGMTMWKRPAVAEPRRNHPSLRPSQLLSSSFRTARQRRSGTGVPRARRTKPGAPVPGSPAAPRNDDVGSAPSSPRPGGAILRFARHGFSRRHSGRRVSGDPEPVCLARAGQSRAHRFRVRPRRPGMTMLEAPRRRRASATPSFASPAWLLSSSFRTARQRRSGTGVPRACRTKPGAPVPGSPAAPRNDDVGSAPPSPRPGGATFERNGRPEPSCRSACLGSGDIADYASSTTVTAPAIAAGTWPAVLMSRRSSSRS